jgi:hypothetical protein
MSVKEEMTRRGTKTTGQRNGNKEIGWNEENNQKEELVAKEAERRRNGQEKWRVTTKWLTSPSSQVADKITSRPTAGDARRARRRVLHQFPVRIHRTFSDIEPKQRHPGM